MIGTPKGRFGNTYVAGVPEQQVLQKKAWRYWDGRTWSPQESAAVPIAVGPISEVSVQWNAYLGKWLMMYLDEQRASVVLRSATSITGGRGAANRWLSEAPTTPACTAPSCIRGRQHPGN
ncbi:DUF4185 domain-containing protein [Kribbella sp. NPDC026596]|uniref:DUF4185 domain-containing protein n=1 Tax=Kribbella sp. NPDC026596 TaxID=3155122 RepID=UPI0033E2CA7A